MDATALAIALGCVAAIAGVIWFAERSAAKGDYAEATSNHSQILHSIWTLIMWALEAGICLLLAFGLVQFVKWAWGN